MNGKAGETYTEGEQQVKAGIRKYIFDIVAAVIILVIIAASLHILDIYDFSNPEEVGNFFVDWIPYFFASILLNADLYEKGVFIGKSTDNFSLVLGDYSTAAGKLTGEQLSAMGPFCIWYNEKAIVELRKDILRKEAIDYDIYNNAFEKDGQNYKPLKLWTKEELDKHYGKNARKAIIKANKAKIQGINAATLLSSFHVQDPTNIGKNESQMKKDYNIYVTIRYLFITGLMSVVFIKDIATWQWAGLLEVLFKVAYVFARAMMSYFKGYSETTVNLASHLTRKTDILKEFDVWYNKYNS